jgi:hypothetical protein
VLTNRKKKPIVTRNPAMPIGWSSLCWNTYLITGVIELSRTTAPRRQRRGDKAGTAFEPAALPSGGVTVD